MEITIPKTSQVMRTLLRADFTTQWRNRRSAVLVLLVPVIILISWKGLIEVIGAPSVVATCVTIGLIAIGLMGYTNSVARDRDKGIFQRLRVAPAPTWCIMASRLIVQLAMIALLILIVFIAGYKFDDIKLSAQAYIGCALTALVGGSVYLSLGQLIVGRVKSPESVNSTTRLIYFLFIMVGMFSTFLPAKYKELKEIVQWSPYGTVKAIVAAGVMPSTWTITTTQELLVTIGYTIVFATLGIKWFKWDTK